MDRLDAMRTLLAAVDGGSLSAAARGLRMPLATVSRKVSELEAHLGTQLLVRTSRKLLPTEAGEAYIAAARRILADIEEAERQAAGEYREPRGQLTITAPVMFGRLHLLPVVLDFLTAYPHIETRLMLADRVVNLNEDHVDVALRIGRLADSAMVATRLGMVRWLACASPAYLATRGTPAQPGDLAGHDCVQFAGGPSDAYWQFGGADGVQVQPRARLVTNSVEAAIEAALAGHGIVRLLSYQLDAAIRAGRLVRLLTDHEPDPVPVSLLHAGHAILPQKLRAFLDFARPRLKAAIPAG